MPSACRSSPRPGSCSAFARANEFDLGPALEQFEARAASVIEAGIGHETIVYDAAFGRPLDYYTGLVYETRAPDYPDIGRYRWRRAL